MLDQGNSGEREFPNIFDTDDLIDEFDRDDDVSDLIIDAESHRGAFGDYGGESGGLIERTFRERIVLVGVTLAGDDPEETDASLDELALLVDTAGADAFDRAVQPVHHPMRPPTSVPVRPRRSRRQPTRSMPTRSSSTTNSPRPSNTTSRRFSAGRRSIAPPSFSTFSPRTPAARRARPRWNSPSCYRLLRLLERTHLLPAGRRYRYQGPG